MGTVTSPPVSPSPAADANGGVSRLPSGLSSSEAQRRLAEFSPNEIRREQGDHSSHSVGPPVGESRHLATARREGQPPLGGRIFAPDPMSFSSVSVVDNALQLWRANV